MLNRVEMREVLTLEKIPGSRFELGIFFRVSTSLTSYLFYQAIGNKPLFIIVRYLIPGNR